MSTPVGVLILDAVAAGVALTAAFHALAVERRYWTAVGMFLLGGVNFYSVTQVAGRVCLCVVEVQQDRSRWAWLGQGRVGHGAAWRGCGGAWASGGGGC